MTLTVYRGSKQAAAASLDELIASWDLVGETPRTVQFETFLRPGDLLAPSLAEADPPPGEYFDYYPPDKNVENYKGEGIALRSLVIEGPLFEDWPPPSARKLLAGVDFDDAGDVVLTKAPYEHVVDVVAGLRAAGFPAVRSLKANSRPMRVWPNRFSRAAGRSSKRCAFRSAPCSALRPSCSRPAIRDGWTITRWRPAFPTFSGGACRTMNCWPGPPTAASGRPGSPGVSGRASARRSQVGALRPRLRGPGVQALRDEGDEPGLRALSRVRRPPGAGDGQGDPIVSGRVDRRGPRRGQPDRRRLHVPQPASCRPLRHPGGRGTAHAQGDVAGRTACVAG